MLADVQYNNYIFFTSHVRNTLFFNTYSYSTFSCISEYSLFNALYINVKVLKKSKIFAYKKSIVNRYWQIWQDIYLPSDIYNPESVRVTGFLSHSTRQALLVGWGWRQFFSLWVESISGWVYSIFFQGSVSGWKFILASRIRVNHNKPRLLFEMKSYESEYEWVFPCSFFKIKLVLEI